jgi:hypothetical protein
MFSLCAEEGYKEVGRGCILAGLYPLRHGSEFTPLLATQGENSMKRIVLALSLALVVSLLVGVGVASASHGTDYAKGTVDQGTQEWRFSATSNFNGTQASGTIRVIQRNNDPDLVMTANVTCLRVVDGMFEARGVITDVRGGTTSLDAVIIRGSDQGKFSTTPDTFAGGFLFTTLPDDPGPCGVPTAGSPVQDGEVIVHDSF